MANPHRHDTIRGRHSIALGSRGSRRGNADTTVATARSVGTLGGAYGKEVAVIQRRVCCSKHVATGLGIAPKGTDEYGLREEAKRALGASGSATDAGDVMSIKAPYLAVRAEPCGNMEAHSTYSARDE